MDLSRRSLLRLSAAAIASLGTGLGVNTTRVFAQCWPDKPVTVIVPFPAGGGTDAFARPLTTELTKRLGKAFIVDNRGGAGGTLGAGPWRRSAPKPHTGTADGVFVR